MNTIAPKQPKTDEQKARTRNKITSLAVFVAIASAGGLGYTIYNDSNSKQNLAPPEVQPTSGPLYDQVATKKEVIDVKTGALIIKPDNIQMGEIVIGESSYSGSFTITSADVISRIKKVDLPFSQQMGIAFDAGACVDKQLAPDESCPVSFTYDPLRANKIDARFTVTAELEMANGSKRTESRDILISGNSVKPTPPPQPVIVQAPVKNDNELSDIQAAFLLNRQKYGLLAGQFDPRAYTYMQDQAPRMDSWSSIGYDTNYSTMPVDMSRVITMDKPIPAVIKLPIDTRNSSRAVATVERDIYGGDGRIVLLERGSTIIGSVASIGSSGEEKVGISWERIVRPDGSAWAFQGTSGDAMGRAGVLAFIDNRWKERFGASLLASALIAGVDILADAETKTTSTATTTTVSESAASKAADAFQTNAGNVVKAFGQEMMSLPVIRTVPVGTRITIFPTSDLWLRPVRPTDEMRARYAVEAQSTPDFIQARQSATEALARRGTLDTDEQNPSDVTNANAPGNVSSRVRPAGTIPSSSGVGTSPLTYRQAGQTQDTGIASNLPSQQINPQPTNNSDLWFNDQSAYQKTISSLRAKANMNTSQNSPGAIMLQPADINQN
jgi:Bacterial conjugation TrbI-like protein